MAAAAAVPCVPEEGLRIQYAAGSLQVAERLEGIPLFLWALGMCKKKGLCYFLHVAQVIRSIPRSHVNFSLPPFTLGTYCPFSSRTGERGASSQRSLVSLVAII